MAQPMQDFVVAALKELAFSDLDAIAKDTKISKWTLQKIRLRQTKNPGVKTAEPLYHYFKMREVKKRRAQ